MHEIGCLPALHAPTKSLLPQAPAWKRIRESDWPALVGIADIDLAKGMVGIG
jgi:hypothetical protein